MDDAMTPAFQKKLTADEYFELERTAEVKHEFYRGDLFAMSGVRDRHNELAGNLFVALREAVRGTGCGVFFADVRLEVEPGAHYVYPDVFVTCDPRDRQDPHTKRHVSLAVEVLSESTASYDRGLKAMQYRKMPSLLCYVIVDPDAQTVEVQTRGEAGAWTLKTYDAPGDVVPLPLGDLRLPWTEVFARAG
jgi:Uma2 family endonuclease